MPTKVRLDADDMHAVEYQDTNAIGVYCRGLPNRRTLQGAECSTLLFGGRRNILHVASICSVLLLTMSVTDCFIVKYCVTVLLNV